MTVIVSDKCSFQASGAFKTTIFHEDDNPTCSNCDVEIKKKDIPPVTGSNRYLIQSRLYYCSLECWKAKNPGMNGNETERGQLGLSFSN